MGEELSGGDYRGGKGDRVRGPHPSKGPEKDPLYNTNVIYPSLVYRNVGTYQRKNDRKAGSNAGGKRPRQ